MLYYAETPRKLYVWHYVVFWHRDGDKIHLFTKHRRQMFKTIWGVNDDLMIAWNLTPEKELMKPRRGGEVPRMAIKVHRAAVKRLGYKLRGKWGESGFTGLCDYVGKCAFKSKRKGVGYCTWPHTCNQKRPLKVVGGRS